MKLQMYDSSVVVGIKNSNLNKSDVGHLRPWKEYYQQYPWSSALELGEMETVDCLERATKRKVYIRPFRLLGT